jgi:hypothetical protein
MADKNAARRPSRQERAVNIMQTRLSWSDAERYAAELAEAGVLESGNRLRAFEILQSHMPWIRAQALVNDLHMYDAMAIDKVRCYGCGTMFEPWTNEWHCSDECYQNHRAVKGDEVRR